MTLMTILQYDDYSTPINGSPFNVRKFDPPAKDDDACNLFTLPYVQMIESLASILFPRNTIHTKNLCT